MNVIYKSTETDLMMKPTLTTSKGIIGKVVKPWDVHDDTVSLIHIFKASKINMNKFYLNVT